MIFVGILIGIVILAAMVYLAVDKKSTLTIRFASLGAIALMFITLVICIIVVLSDNTVHTDPSVLIVGAPPEVKEDKNNSFAIIFSIIFVIILFVIIAVIAMREHKKTLPKSGSIDIPDDKPAEGW